MKDPITIERADLEDFLEVVISDPYKLDEGNEILRIKSAPIRAGLDEEGVYVEDVG